MLALVDENIPFAGAIFSGLGEVRLAPGRALTPDSVREADMLIVRSVTKVDRCLLAGSRVRFVGSATSGIDHVDLAWLEREGIAFASAPGSNAESVAQYVAAALAIVAGRLGLILSRASIGIIGVGHCGSRVERIARTLGKEVVLNDPPLARVTGDPKYRPLEELMDCDVLTLHVPLVREGEDPTWGLVNEQVLRRLKPGSVVINASRGHVVDEAVLLAHLESGRLGGAVVDTWENEPEIDPRLLERALVATPHIAGYSLDGKVAGARTVAEAASRHFEIPLSPPDLPLPPAEPERIEIDAESHDADSILGRLVLTAYPIERDDQALRATMNESPPHRGKAFAALRRDYPTRREFAATMVHLRGANDELRRRVRALGFTVQAP
jgi:erythronate-4-phosphate dehydrogenase